MENGRLIELLTAGIFAALLLIVILLVAGNSGAENESKTTIISNSFNTYPTYSGGHTPDSYYSYNYDRYRNSRYRDMAYYDYGRSYHTYGVFGNDISRYYVSVKNVESQGGYFTVKFYFKDDYGRTRTETVTKYIRPHDYERFSYQKIYDDNYRYWRYDVVSDSRVPTRYY